MEPVSGASPSGEGVMHSITLENSVQEKRETPGREGRKEKQNGGDSRPHAVIIGAGLGGLATGIHLSREGWRVEILERNERSGGRMNQIVEDGFKIDMGPTMLMMPEVVENIFSSCGRDWKDYLDWKRIEPAYRIQWPDGSVLDMGENIEQMSARVARFAPEDAEAFPVVLKKMKAKYTNARGTFIENSFNSITSMMRPSVMLGMMKTLPYESVYKFVNRHLKNDKLRQALTFQTLYLGTSPYDCPSIYALLPYIEMEFGVWFPKGGTIAIADAMERLFRELGGEIHFNAPAERILLEGKKAVGVKTMDERQWHADAVIANMDLTTAYMKLLPPEVRRKNTDAKLLKKNYGCSGYLLYLGVKDLDCTLPHNTILLSDGYEQLLADTCRNGVLPADPAMHICIPTRTDPDLAPEGHDVVYLLVPCANADSDLDWETEIPKLRERVLSKLERSVMPNLREKIVFEREFTPPMFLEQYGCHAGAAYAALTPDFFQSAYFRPHSRSEDVKNLYFVGSSTHPGGGVPIVITAGRLTAEEVIATVKR